MRLINLIDNCGQLLNIIHNSKYSSDRVAEEFFRKKRKLIGSKERKFISQIVFSTIRNLLLIKNIAAKFELHSKINNPAIFPNATEHSIYILVQLLLIESFPKDFDLLDIDKIKYKNDNSTLNIIDSVCLDLNIVRNSDNIALFLKNELTNNIISYYSELTSTLIKHCKNHTEKPENNNENDFFDNTLGIVSKRFSFNNEFLKILLETSSNINIDNIFDFAKAMNFAAPVCIRINSSKCDISSVTKELDKHSVSYYLSELLPACVIIPERRQLLSLDSYQNGSFTIQDEASQLVGYCISPETDAVILDACAGAGGKSLHLADLQKNQGKIIASDISSIKIKELSKRAKMSNFSSIHFATANSSYDITSRQDNILHSKKLQNPVVIPRNYFDVVLVDAPCTGSGVIRRDPIKKYTILPKTIAKIATLQLEVLTNYSKYVKDGGSLVYSTCSIFPAENEFIIQKFLQENTDFIGEPLLPSLKSYNIKLKNLSDSDFYITLYPFIHNTDGFFICKMRKV